MSVYIRELLISAQPIRTVLEEREGEWDGGNVFAEGHKYGNEQTLSDEEFKV